MDQKPSSSTVYSRPSEQDSEPMRALRDIAPMHSLYVAENRSHRDIYWKCEGLECYYPLPFPPNTPFTHARTQPGMRPRHACTSARAECVNVSGTVPLAGYRPCVSQEVTPTSQL